MSMSRTVRSTAPLLLLRTPQMTSSCTNDIPDDN
jgi:hypothetical protein